MAVTRIKNNQITDSAINAAAKMQDYSITGGKISNNLTYGSNLTISGNLNVTGNTTTINTVDLQVEDPIIVLADEQTGSPTLDIGYIGKRGTSTSVAFVWQESSSEFVTAFTNSASTNTTIAISSYANLKSNNIYANGHVNVDGNLTVTGRSFLGNLLIATSSNINVGNNTIGNLAEPVANNDAATKAYVDGIASSGFTIEDDTANTTIVAGGDTLTLNGTVNEVTVAITAADEVTFGLPDSVTVTSTLTAGNVATGGTVSATGTATAGNIATGGTVSATGNVTGGNVATSGLVQGGTVSSTGAISSTGTATVGNLATAGTVSATSTVTGGNLATGGTVSATSNITGGNLATGGTVSATSTITGGNLATAGTVSATSNITGGNLATGGTVSATSTITGGNLATGGTVSATSTITGGNLATSGSVQGGTISSTGTATVGNLATAGTVSSTGNVTGGNVLTGGAVSATGNVTGGNLITAGTFQSSSISATGNITGGNLYTAGLVSAAGTATVGNLATSGTISSTGTATAGNLATGGTVSSTGTVTGGNLATGGTTSAAGTITGGNLATGGTASATGNVTGGNIITGGYVSATGNVNGASVNTSSINNTGALTITTTTGNINLEPSGNIVLNNKYINGLNQPVQDNDAASKIYVDNMVSTQLSYHQAVVVATTTTLATATGGTVTYNNGTGGVGATLTTTGAFNLIDTGNVQTVGARILVKNEANAAWNGVYTYANATSIVRSTDTDTYGPNSVTDLSINDYFFVSAGSVNAGSAWICDAPTGTITFGTSNISFAQFSSSQTYTAGNGVSINGTVISAKVDDVTTAFDGLGNIIVKASAQLTTPNIGAATGTSVSLTGTATVGNVNTGGVVSATGTVTGGNVATSGTVSATSTITGGNLATGGTASATGTITGGNVATAGTVSSTGTITGGNVLTGGTVSSTGTVTGGNLATAGTVSSTGTVTGGNLATGGTTSAAGTITGGNLATGGTASATGNITGGNVLTGGTVSSTGTVTGGNLATGGTVSATSTITGGNLATAGTISSTGTATVGNLATGGTVSAVGNITANVGSFFIGNGSQLTGVVASSANAETLTGAFLANNVVGSSLTSVGNLTLLSVVGTATVGNLATAGTVSATGTATAGNIATGGTVSATGNVTGGNIATAGTVSATSNITGGNLATGGTVSATSTITGGNVATGGTVSATSTITGGNLATGGTVSATSTITGGNLATGGTASATGTITGGNVLTGGNVSATGNVIGGNIVISGDNITDTNGRVNFNSALGAVDLAVNGGAANVFYVSAASNSTSFGNSTQVTNAIAAFNTTTSIKLPSGTTAQRPATGVTGMMRFNTSINNLEFYDNDSWETAGTTFTLIAANTQTGDGTKVAFTMPGNSTTAGTIVSINGVVQIPITAYSVSGNTCTFTEAPVSTDVIDFRQLTTTSTITGLAGIGGASVQVSDVAANVNVTGNLIVTGGTLVGDGSGLTNLNVSGNSISFGTSNVAVRTNNGNVETNVNGTTVQTISPGLVNIVGDLTVSGNATLSGNILGDKILNGTTSIEIQTPSGNANITVGGTSNVAVFTTTGVVVNGNISATGDVTAQNVNSLSDMTLKTNINPLTDVEAIINRLFGVEYDWKNGTGHSYGLLAQDVEKVLPDAVRTSDAGLKSVNYMMIIPFLIESIKKLGSEVAELKKKSK